MVAEYIVQQGGLLPEDFEIYYREDLRSKEPESRPAQPPTTIIGRHYAFLGYQDDGLLKKTHVSINGLQNTDDQSAFLAMIFRYYLSPITSVELAPTFFKGGVDSEFGESPFASVTYLVFKGRF